jgi:uncharacterized protein DUF6220
VSASRLLFALAAVAYVVGIVIQVLLAGAALFDVTDFDAHVGLGWLLGSAPILLIPLAILARAGPGTVSLTIVLTVDAMIQPELALARHDSPVIAAVHPVNALILFWLALVVARRAIVLAREGARRSAPAATAIPAPTATASD